MVVEANEAEAHYIAFGYLLVLGYLGFYFFNLLVATPRGYENLPIRVIVSFLGVSLILHKTWPLYCKKYMPIFWYFTLVFSLPFFFTFMLFHNPQSNIWQINGLVGMVTLTFFVDWVVYILLAGAGVIFAYIAFYFTGGMLSLPSELLGVLGSYSAPVIYLVLFSHKRRKLYKEKQLAEMQKFNSRLLKQSEDLQRALAVKTEFLNNLSHEVRTPISGVVNISEIMLENWNFYTAEERYENMKNIAKSGQRLLTVMSSILDLSKFTSGKMDMQMEGRNLGEVVKEVTAECKSFLTNKAVDIKLNIPDHFDSLIMMDKERIAQVLRNLINNAIKFTNKGEIAVSLRRQENYLEVSVKDTGIGIPKEELEEIFTPFIQSSRTKNHLHSTGLGLSICQEIISAHSGKIWAESSEGKGAEFYFLLPYTKSESGNRPSESKTSARSKGVALMIDDDEVCHKVMGMLLKGAGYEMISQYGGKEGLDYLATHKDEVDFILLDIMMPGMSGLEVLKTLKADKNLCYIPVIIQSATNDSGELNRTLALGAISVFSKPYNRIKIMECINKIMKPDL